MSRRVNVTIDRIVVDPRTVADMAAFRAEVERQVALSLRAPGAVEGLTGRHAASDDAGRVKDAGDPRAVAGAVAAAIAGGGRR